MEFLTRQFSYIFSILLFVFFLNVKSIYFTTSPGSLFWGLALQTGTPQTEVTG